MGIPSRYVAALGTTRDAPLTFGEARRNLIAFQIGKATLVTFYDVGETINKLRYAVETLIGRLRMMGKKFHGLREGLNSLVDVHCGWFSNAAGCGLIVSLRQPSLDINDCHMSHLT